MRPFSLARSAAGLVVAAGLAFAPSLPASAAEATVFAAASLTDVMQTLAEGFQAGADNALTVVPGSSSTLARQILAGGPADLFISANKTYADRVAEATGQLEFALFGNALAIIAPSSYDGAVSLYGLSDALGGGRLAVGDPAHVPAGIYAKEALTNAGLWDDFKNRLAPAGDVRAAVGYVVQGAAPFGIVYRTDAAVDGVEVVGAIPDDLHAPIRYWAVLLKPENRAASAFLSYVQSDNGKAVLAAAGFTPQSAAK